MFPLPFLIRKLKSCTTKIIWDFDDDILQSKEISPKEYQLLSINSNKIFVTHTYLANKIDKKYRDKVSILPTTDGDFLNIDLQQQLLHRKEIFNQELRLVWVGSAVNLSHLKPIVSTLDECARIFIEKYNKNIILKVCCSEPLCMATRFLQIENILWEREIAVKCIESSHLGIMPLLPTDYSLGKGGFKLIQYMAAGLPVIGSAVGFNNTIVKNEFGCLISELSNFNEWFCALKKWGINFEDYQKASIASQKEWERSFFMPNNLKKWADALNVEIK